MFLGHCGRQIANAHEPTYIHIFICRFILSTDLSEGVKYMPKAVHEGSFHSEHCPPTAGVAPEISHSKQAVIRVRVINDRRSLKIKVLSYLLPSLGMELILVYRQ